MSYRAGRPFPNRRDAFWDRLSGFQTADDQRPRGNRAGQTDVSRRFLHRRLCVPASSFYEWTASKEKVAFFDPDEQTMFLAGFFQNGQFILLTHPANASMRPFHHRMPLLLRADQVKDWLFDTQKAIALLEQENGDLRHWMSHQQGTLFRKDLIFI